MPVINVLIRKVGYVDLLIDDQDIAFIQALKRIYLDADGYPTTTVRTFQAPIHRHLVGTPPNGFVTDHIDRNKFNIQRSNLRFVTRSVNAANTNLTVKNTSGFKGVRLVGKLWQTRLTVNGIEYARNGFKTAIEAACAYDQLVKLHQPYSTTNKELGLI